MDGSHNYKNYRKELAAASSPCIPFVGVIAKDLSAIDEIMPDQTDGLWNFAKARAIL